MSKTLRATPTYLCALGATLLCPAAACMNPDAPSTAETAPVVGRLQTRAAVTDLTVHSFADGPGSVPINSYAKVVADIAPSVRRDDDSNDRSAETSDFAGKRGF